MNDHDKEPHSIKVRVLINHLEAEGFCLFVHDLLATIIDEKTFYSNSEDHRIEGLHFMNLPIPASALCRPTTSATSTSAATC